jgi:hypothetical protein
MQPFSAPTWKNVTGKKSKYALFIKGYVRPPITDVYLKDCTFDNVAKPSMLVGVKNLFLENVNINDGVVNNAVDELSTVGSSSDN